MKSLLNPKKMKARLDLPNVAMAWHQQLAMRVFMGPFVANASNPAQNRRTYEHYSQKIIDLAATIPFERHKIAVLVPAQTGLLDDTRYWSLTDTFEHLLLLDRLTKEIIVKLSKGIEPHLNITPAVVAPTGRVDAETIFNEFKAQIPKRLDEIDQLFAAPKFNATLTAEHPFFGHFNARQWQWSLTARTALRFRSVTNICKGLSEDIPRLSLLPESPGA